MRDLAFDIIGRDRTQAAFNAAQRNARSFGMGMRNVERDIARATGEMDRFGNAARRAEANIDRMSRGVAFRRRNMMMQLFDVGQMAALGQNPAMLAMQQGPQIAQLYAGQGGLRAAGSDLMGMFGRLGPIALGAAAVVGTAFAGIQHEINAASGVAVSFGDVAKASMQLAGDAAWDILKPAVDAIAPWFASAWDMVVAGTKTAVNLFIGGWMVQIDALSTGIGAIPDAFLVAGEGAANGFLSAIEQMVRESLVAINGLLTDVNGMFRSAGLDGMQVPLAPSPMSFRVGRVNLGGAAARDRLGAAWEGFTGRTRDNLSRDYAGDAFDALSQQAVQNALARTGEAAEEAGGRAAGAGKRAADAWTGLREVSDDAFQRFESAGQKIGGTLRGLIDGTRSWKDALLDIGRAIAQWAFAKMDFGGGGFGGLLKGIFGGLLGFRAEGGPVDPWGTYVVGEKGPEILRMGGRGGHVTSNERAFGGGAGASTYAPVYNIDARGADVAAVARLEKGLLELNRTFSRRAVSAVRVPQLRGVRP